MKKIKKGDVLNGTFKAVINDQEIKELSGFKSIVVGENDLKSNLDDFLIDKKYKRHYAFEVTLNEDYPNKDLQNQVVSLEISDVNITTSGAPSEKDKLKEEVENLKKENEELKLQVATLNNTLRTSEYLFKEKMLQASDKAQKTIEEKTLEIANKYAKDKEEVKKFALQKLASELAVPYNNLLMATKAGENSDNAQVKNYCYGFSLVIKQLQNALNESGIELIEPNVGEIFNAHEQEAIDVVSDSSMQHEQIVAVIRVGFKLQDRTIVPAQVKINKNL
ncbi:nucleotide exchange factor GrpE [Mycoplasmopsis columboralis]|uniref:Protein GrpE n=1 Tax=Mycoplasmopsis columboralis TaxID=171282 RepID=A0A449B6L3_9BACT|nr:nucleotide exchange factor GrpE [Mycoplasmopsis columboralis]VEU76195.1 Chaperone protein GrpE [Mycoplasmopsis columboralis]